MTGNRITDKRPGWLEAVTRAHDDALGAARRLLAVDHDAWPNAGTEQAAIATVRSLLEAVDYLVCAAGYGNAGGDE